MKTACKRESSPKHFVRFVNNIVIEVDFKLTKAELELVPKADEIWMMKSHQHNPDS